MTINSARPAAPAGSELKTKGVRELQRTLSPASRVFRKSRLTQSGSLDRGSSLTTQDGSLRSEKFSVSSPASELMQVAAFVEERSLEPDERLLILVEGDPANHLMVLVEGQGVAQLGLDQGLMALSLVGPSEVAGWWPLLDG